MSFFSKPRTEQHHLICIATSYSAIATVVRTYHGNDATTYPVVLFSHQESIDHRHGRNASLLNEMTCAAMARSVSACRRFHAKYESIVCAIGEPWVTTMSRSVHLEKTDPIVVTQKLLNDAVARDRKLFELDLAKDFPNRDIGLVQASLPTIWVNGYQVRHPLGAQAQSLDVSVSYSVSDSGFLDEMAGVFLDAFHRDDVKFISTEIAQVRGVPETVERLIVNLGGSTSTLSIIDRGRATYHLSIPVGLSDFEERIAQSFGVTKSMIPSILNFSSDTMIGASKRDEYSTRIRESYAPLGVAIERAAMELKRHVGSLPRQVYVSGIPEWVSVLEPLVAANLGIEMVSDIPSGMVVYVQSAQEHPLVTCVILEALSR